MPNKDFYVIAHHLTDLKGINIENAEKNKYKINNEKE